MAGLKRLSTQAGKALAHRGLKLSVAESCTGGLLGSTITDTPGSSAYFMGAVVSYDNAVKEALLGVKTATLKRHGAVSKEIAKEMARGIAKRLGTGASVAITGIAGPGGATKGKPVGTVFIAVYLKGRVKMVRYAFKGARSAIKKQSVASALRLLIGALEPTKKGG